MFADRLLLNCYKLRQHFNGVTRYRSALAGLEEIEKQVRSSQTVDYIRRIAAQEPSSFELIGYHLALRSPQRAVSVHNGDTGFMGETQEGTRPYDFQGKMPL